ncbi:Hint domain-containing protein [Marinibacterium sp. SX1]|uniref:Hint domain-containing protein n=1 Tax=Marinibacterium sp. SX1 TaxID=3388424 RepID=UPI003D184BC4
MRRYRIRTLDARGDITESFQLAPALPLFEEAFSAFARGSTVETDMGPMAVEDLLPGDRVMTRDGGAMEIRWIGSTIYVPGHASHKARNLHLTRIMADSFGLARPSACLLTGPAARLLQGGSEGMLTPVQGFVDGISVIETAPPAPVELFHMCLARHAVIRVGGMEFETYHPGADAARRVGQSLRPAFMALFPGIGGLEDFGRPAYKRAPFGLAEAV